MSTTVHSETTTTRTIIELLFERAKPLLTRDDLEHLSFAVEHASEVSRQSAVVTELLGWLMSYDKDIGQDSKGAANLMFYVAENFNQVRALTDLGDDARALLHQWDERTQADSTATS